MEQPLIVQAEYSFKGGNNDELCFKKGDLITVTQREEGGWWEGTLDDKTGWFPSNYVNECKAPLPITDSVRPPEEIQEYRSVVLKDLLDSERAHVAELQGLLENFLEPLQQTQILTADEYAQLMCNFVEIVKVHEELLTQMEECNDRIGKLFLTKAPHLKQVHQSYCAAHPRAIVILDKHKDELTKYMERQGASTPGLLVLTTGLSKPFRRLDKYSAMLQELERHMESSHPDRGDTQRSVAVFKDIAATCSATRRQKELELQVLTGPVRGWQGQELSSLGDIIHMGSVAVGPDHRDRYFVLFPQTLLILSVSQRMSAFIYEGKLPLTGIIVNRLEDNDNLKNAFEISGPLIERIVAVCQGPNEANKWVDLLTANNLSVPIGIKRQLSNLSNSSIGGGIPGGANIYTPQHMSPPANLSMLSQRTTNPQQQSTASTTPSPNAIVMGTPPLPALAAGFQSGLSHPSQHKRSLSFNHHLSYNQFTHTQHPPHHLHHQQQPPSLPNHPVAVPSHKSNLAPIPNSISKTQVPAATINMANAKTANIKANWSITNLRPAPPLRPCLLNTSTNSSSSGGGGGSSNALSSYCNSRKMQPTFEEDALVLRVFEAYCAAYQNNARNTIHSALQPWTPCLPIRGGKLKTSKPFSTSNPQLPFLCNAMGAVGGTSAGGGGVFYASNTHHQPNSTNSLNSSFIWREASPNNFNLYSSSISSLTGASGYRYSLTGAGPTTTGMMTTPGNGGIDYRALSEERATRKSLNRFKSGFGSGYDNIFMTPLLPRKNKTSPKLMQSKNTNYQSTVEQRQQLSRSPKKILRNNSEEHPPSLSKVERYPPMPGLYDRRLNRSFETSSRMGYAGLESTPTLRRSTPHLAAEDSDESDRQSSGHRGCGLLGSKNHSGENASDSQRHSGTWCCGLENEDMTPTLRQLWTAMRQMQQDVSQIKLQINEERALRVSLQQLLLQHLENNSSAASSTNSSNNTPKC